MAYHTKKFLMGLFFHLSVAVIVLFGGVLPSYGQGTSQNSKMDRQAREYIKKDAPTPEEKKFVENYLKNNLLRWAKNPGNLPELRDALRRVLQAGASVKSDVYKDYLNLSYTQLRKYALTSTNEPVLRINALYALGDLDASYNNQEIPVPHAEVTDLFVKIMSSTKIPGYMRVAAMRGLLRHTRVAIPAADKGKVMALLDKLAFEDISKKTSAEASWICEMALDGLGNLADPGSKGERIEQMMRLVNSPSASLEIRMAAANAILRMKNITAATCGRHKPAEILISIGRLASVALTNEYHREYNLQKKTGYDGFHYNANDEEWSDDIKKAQCLSLSQRIRGITYPLYQNIKNSSFYKMESERDTSGNAIKCCRVLLYLSKKFEDNLKPPKPSKSAKSSNEGDIYSSDTSSVTPIYDFPAWKNDLYKSIKMINSLVGMDNKLLDKPVKEPSMIPENSDLVPDSVPAE